MMRFRIQKLFDGCDWLENAIMLVDNQGKIISIERAQSENFDVNLGLVIPGFHNAHSHGFQRAIAGWCEQRQGLHEDFWSWRQQMYGVANRLNPEINRKICQWLFVEELEAGYTSHCEFHYVHKPHCNNLNKIDDRRAALEMSQSIITAAQITGMPVCLMPVLYEQAGPNRAPTQQQAAFTFNSVEDYLDLLQSVGNVRKALCLHSLRAVRQSSLTELSHLIANSTWASLPIHMHISEQPLEIAEIEAAYGLRPLLYLNSIFELDSRWQLVHATHFDEDEISWAVKQDARIVLCPTTEANLGDGIFALENFYSRGGKFTIGSDSNIVVDPFQEIVLLEYAQRLKAHRRITVCDSQTGSCGEALVKNIHSAAASSFGDDIGFLKAGYLANFISIRKDHPSLIGVPQEKLMDAIIFAAGKGSIDEVYVEGQCKVKDGHFIDRETFRREYSQCIAELRGIS